MTTTPSQEQIAKWRGYCIVRARPEKYVGHAFCGILSCSEFWALLDEVDRQAATIAALREALERSAITLDLIELRLSLALSKMRDRNYGLAADEIDFSRQKSVERAKDARALLAPAARESATDGAPTQEGT